MRRFRTTIPSPGRRVREPSRSVIPTSTGSSGISPARRNTTAGSPSRRSSGPSCGGMTSRSMSATFGIEIEAVAGAPVALPGLRDRLAPGRPGVSPLANHRRPSGADQAHSGHPRSDAAQRSRGASSKKPRNGRPACGQTAGPRSSHDGPPHIAVPRVSDHGNLPHERDRPGPPVPACREATESCRSGARGYRAAAGPIADSPPASTPRPHHGGALRTSRPVRRAGRRFRTAQPMRCAGRALPTARPVLGAGSSREP